MRLQHPPPYRAALRSSINSLILHQTPRRDERIRKDIDLGVFNNLKYSLLTQLPNIDQDSRFEQSIDLDTYARSEADSAFIEASSNRIQPMNPHQPIELNPATNGTYSPLPGIITEELTRI